MVFLFQATQACLQKRRNKNSLPQELRRGFSFEFHTNPVTILRELKHWPCKTFSQQGNTWQEFTGKKIFHPACKGTLVILTLPYLHVY
jgi:hypothetical protein